MDYRIRSRDEMERLIADTARAEGPYTTAERVREIRTQAEGRFQPFRHPLPADAQLRPATDIEAMSDLAADRTYRQPRDRSTESFHRFLYGLRACATLSWARGHRPAPYGTQGPCTVETLRHEAELAEDASHGPADELWQAEGALVTIVWLLGGARAPFAHEERVHRSA